jgi:pimeloyl-ACP methyl ester carboxylesterase
MAGPMSAMHSVPAADGVPLYVELDGPADAPVTVVLVHGWTLDRRLWAPVARAVVDGSTAVRVLRYDHRGPGRSSRRR